MSNSSDGHGVIVKKCLMTKKKIVRILLRQKTPHEKFLTTPLLLTRPLSAPWLNTRRRLLRSYYRCHVLRHLCEERPMIRFELRTRPHPYALPTENVIIV